ncbi:hypothetical protein HS088_TW13G01281 [Tripterygium wilfordii]|uniref:Uncharacterized protein n=1 Tax=Tripterygium wilfordii TaxID=458696 RepID=A0A7J7CW70_TRIWF|nr:hypothetical protein HS088_TW13G01281 [Tripterygium wilfordii]
MAALSTGNFVHGTCIIHQELKKYNYYPRTLSCQIRESSSADQTPVAETKIDNQKKNKKKLSEVFVSGLDKIGKGLKDYKC